MDCNGFAVSINFVVKDELKLVGLEFLIHLEGKRYSELDRPLQRVIDQTQVIAYVINPDTPALVKYNFLKRINTGGLVLEPQEIGHALHQGVPAEFIAELASLESFKEATQKKIPSNRMLDREFVNRSTQEDHRTDVSSNPSNEYCAVGRQACNWQMFLSPIAHYCL